MNVSVGIPAFNEAANIGSLIRELLSQREDGFSLVEIVVASDGSTDETEAVVRSFDDPRVKLLADGQRRGVIYRQNQLFSVMVGDVLVLMNADVLPVGNQFLSKFVEPFRHDQHLGIVSNPGSPLPSETWFESVINLSVRMKHDAVVRWAGGDNLYLCHGHSRAFSRAFADKLRWPEEAVAEDAYAYLRCRELGFKFRYQPEATVVFRSPQTLSDHLKQSRRFFRARAMLERLLDPAAVRAAHAIPLRFLFPAAFRTFTADPLKFLAYLAVAIYAKTLSLFSVDEKSAWDTAVSSKKLR